MRPALLYFLPLLTPLLLFFTGQYYFFVIVVTISVHSVPWLPLLLKFTLIFTWIWCSILWFLPQRFYFWVCYSDSTLDQVELMFSRRVHACMLYFLHIWECVPFDLYLNDILIGCNILGSLFLALGTLWTLLHCLLRWTLQQKIWFSSSLQVIGLFFLNT